MEETARKTISFADFTFETSGNILFRNGGIIALEPAAARVLRYFLENNGRLIAKEEILDAVWAEVFTTEDVLKRAVSQIRRALGDDARNSRFIETHHRRGYRFIVNPVSDEKPVNKNNFNLNNSARKFEPDEPIFDCFVGRTKEIEFLSSEFRSVLQGAGQPVLIVGDAGIGKTQTAANFVKSVQRTENVIPLRVRFFDYEASFTPPYNLFLDLLSEACAAIFFDGVKPEKSALRETIETNFKINFPEELFSVSADAPQSFADASRTIVPLADSFVHLSRIRPLVLIFDDIQWADETSRKIIGYLMRIAPDTPLMIVGLTRRAESENPQSAVAEWLQKQAVYRSFTTLELAPLTTENCRAVIGEIFRGKLDTNEIGGGDLEKLQAATGGNPYFLVETLRLLMNENVIEKVSDNDEVQWHWRGIRDVPLPETIRMAARAKLVELSDEARDLVECAAVLGDTFQIKTLRLMLQSENKQTDEIIETFLDEAIAAQVLSEQNVSGADDCQFYHTTLRRAVYMDLSPRRRRRLHWRAMQAIEKSHADETERFAAALAAHAENADEFQTSLKLNLQACRAAAARFDWLEAAALIARAERAASKIPAAKFSVSESFNFLALRGEVYMSVGRRAEAEKILVQAVKLAEETAEITDSSGVLLDLGRTRILLGKYREAIAPLEKSLVLARETANDFGASAAQIQLASAKYALCDYDESCEILQKIIDDKNTGDYNRAVALGKLGWTRGLQSRYAEAKNLLKKSLEFHRTAGDLRERAVLAMCLNWCEYGTGDYEAAIEYARQARREAEIVGEPYNESVAMMRIAKARIVQGLYAEAENLLADAWEKQKNLDAAHSQAETVWMRGRLCTKTGEFEKARSDLQTALEMIENVGDRDDEFRILIDQADLQIKLENYTEAVNLAERATQIAEEISISEGIGETLIVKSRALTALGKHAEAIHAARQAVRILEEFASGESRHAFHALASALSAENKKANFAEIESALRRSVEMLEAVRGQFSDTEELRFIQFTRSLNAPARDLYDLLLSAKRHAEAEEISRQWLLG